MAQRLLRPMQYVEMLDEMFDLYRKHFLLFVGITLVATLPFAILTGLFVQPGKEMPGSPAASIGLGLTAFLSYFAGLIATGAITWAVSSCYLGKVPTIMESYRAIRGIIGPFILTMLLVSILQLVGFMACIVPCVLMLFAFAFSSEAVIIEKITYFDAMKRSYALLNTDRPRIAMNLFLTALIYIAASIVVAIPISIISAMSATAVGSMHPMFGVSQVVSTVLSSIIEPILVITIVMVYYDARVRGEGFDLQVLAQSLGTSQDSTSTETGGDPIQ